MINRQHLAGTNAGNPGVKGACGVGNPLAGPTDVLGEMTCLQAVPRGKSFDALEYRYCPGGVLDNDCEVITKDDIRFVDPNEVVFLISDRETCEGIRKGQGTVVRDPCPNAGSVCTTGEEGRCNIGRIRCINQEEVCVKQFEPMPEICNGLDDDCDGVRDNITASWPKPPQTPDQLPEGYEEVECRQTDACICPDGRSDSHVGEDFQSYVRGWGGACYCSGN